MPRWTVHPTRLQIDSERSLLIQVNSTRGATGPLRREHSIVGIYAPPELAKLTVELTERALPKLLEGAPGSPLPEPLGWDRAIHRLAVSLLDWQPWIVIQSSLDLQWYCLPAFTVLTGKPITGSGSDRF